MSDTFDIRTILIEDVTSEEAASDYAAAASESAQTASVKATEAGTQAAAATTARTGAETARGQAQTSAANAAQSETNAAAAASSASQSATTAAQSATTAGQQAQAASGSASTATTKATEAGQSAQAAAGSATTAATEAGKAGTSATQAATSASNAAGSASTASTAASTAASARDAAQGHASAASTSASNAAASATTAGQQATTATTRANEAATSAGTASTKATEAATSATNAAGSATQAATSASVSASAAQQAEVARNTGAVLPSTFAGGLEAFTTRRNLGPDAAAQSANLTLGTGDADFGSFGRWTPSSTGANVNSRGVIPATDRTVRITIDFKVASITGADTVALNVFVGLLNAEFSDQGNFLPGQIFGLGRHKLVAVVSGQAAPEVTNVLPNMRSATRPWLRAGLRLNENRAVEIHIGSILIEDITSEVNSAASARASADSATTAAASATAAGQEAAAAQTARIAAETAKGSAETAAANAATSATNAQGSASSAATSASTAATSRTNAENAASAASQSATTATTKATEASQSATAAATARTGAETARGQAETSATNAATSATNAEGSKNAAATSATTSATTLTDLQRALNNTTTVLATIPTEPMKAYGIVHTGLPDTYTIPVSTLTYASDANGPMVGRPATDNQNGIYARALVPAGTDDRVYRITARLKVSAALTMRIRVAWVRPDGSAITNSAYRTTSVAPDDGIVTLSMVFGRTSGGLVTQTGGTIANWNDAIGLRVGVDNQLGVSGASYQLYELKVEDLTQADLAARQATSASDSASASATSASQAAASSTTAGQAASAAETARTQAQTARSGAESARDTAITARQTAESAASTATTQAGLATTARTDAQNSASAASTSASNAASSASAAGTSASTASSHASTAQTQAGIATTQASNAATSATNAAGSASAAQNYTQLASLALSGGMAKNPTFQDWTGAWPANTTVTITNGSGARIVGKYGNALRLNVTSTAAQGPKLSLNHASGHLSGVVNPAKILVRAEIEVLSGNPLGVTFNAGWTAGTATTWIGTAFGATLTTGGIQTIERVMERPASVSGTVTNFMVEVNSSHSSAGGTRSLCEIVVHRFDVVEVLADSYIDQTLQTKAQLDGMSLSTYLLRLKAGGSTAALELVAANNPQGPASQIRIAADDILLDGTVRAPQLAAGSITASKLAVGDFTNAVLNNDLKDAADWTLESGVTVVGAGAVANQTASGLIKIAPGLTNNVYARWGVSVNTRISVIPGEQYWIGAYCRGSGTSPVQFTPRFGVVYYRGDGTLLSESYVNMSVVTNTSFNLRDRHVTIPAGASFMQVAFGRANVDLSNHGDGYIEFPFARRKSTGELIVNGTITGDHIQANSIASKLATIDDAYIKEANITGTLSAAILRAGTALTNTLTVDGTALSTTTSRAADPAARINAAATTIDPGKIRITGSTTLADWRKGGDETRIDGGAISANTIRANSLEIGSRNLTLTGIQFEHNSPSNNSVSWTAGQIRWVNDANVAVSTTISAGSATWSSGVLYIYWPKNGSSLLTTTAQATAFATDNVILATYQGGVALDVDYGRTIVDGSTIKTGTIRASNLIQSQAVITGTAQIADAVISEAKISGTLNANILRAGTSLANSITVDGTSLSTINGRAANPAARVNEGTTRINPGQILIAGSTTLDNWRNPADSTRINGGWISANTISADKLEIGSRNMTLTGIRFEHNSPGTNQVRWSAGSIRFIADDNVARSQGISAGSATWTSGVLYIYWLKGENLLRTTTSQAVAFGMDAVTLATYEGGIRLDADYGRTIVDGSEIKTGTITATQLVQTAALITNTAQIGNAVVSTLKIGNNAVTVPVTQTLTTRLNGNGGWQQVSSATLSLSERGVVQLQWFGSQGYDAQQNQAVGLRLRRGSTVLWSRITGSPEGSAGLMLDWLSMGWSINQDSGSSTYFVDWWGGNSNLWLGTRTFTLLGAMR